MTRDECKCPCHTNPEYSHSVPCCDAALDDTPNADYTARVPLSTFLPHGWAIEPSQVDAHYLTVRAPSGYETAVGPVSSRTAEVILYELACELAGVAPYGGS